MIERFFFNILTDDVARSKSFYIELLDMHLHFDSDWFVILKPDEKSNVEFGIIDQNSPVAPDSVQRVAGGIYPTFVVKDANVIHTRAVDLGTKILEAPTDMFYGQRRLLVGDPNGFTVDISSPTATL